MSTSNIKNILNILCKIRGVWQLVEDIDILKALTRQLLHNYPNTCPSFVARRWFRPRLAY